MSEVLYTQTFRFVGKPEDQHWACGEGWRVLTKTFTGTGPHDLSEKARTYYEKNKGLLGWVTWTPSGGPTPNSFYRAFTIAPRAVEHLVRRPLRLDMNPLDPFGWA